MKYLLGNVGGKDVCVVFLIVNFVVVVIVDV